MVLAMDKFKGTLTALQACEGVREGLATVLHGVECTLCPIADGGEGTVVALATRLPGKLCQAPVEDAMGRGMVTAWYLLDRSRSPVTAYLEMASASGLALLPEKERDPLRATTYGTGRLMKAAWEAGARRLVLGLGGSATNDGGTGVARAFGYRFLDAAGNEIVWPQDLAHLKQIVAPDPKITMECLLLADVSNPLLGADGATAVYGPQKKVTPMSAPILERGLERLADVVAREFGQDYRDVPGAGAAGGCAFGLMNFLGAELVPGFDYVSACLGLEEAIAGADWVITGEGRMDRQTLSGKGPAGVAALAKKHGKRVAALCGDIAADARPELAKSFDCLVALTDAASLDRAKEHPLECLVETSRHLGETLLAKR